MFGATDKHKWTQIIKPRISSCVETSEDRHEYARRQWTQTALRLPLGAGQVRSGFGHEFPAISIIYSQQLTQTASSNDEGYIGCLQYHHQTNQ
jgi:hypothetical protein